MAIFISYFLCAEEELLLAGGVDEDYTLVGPFVSSLALLL